jgi:DNA-binding NarL/FixJ family response regulator
MNTKRFLIADDHNITRMGVKLLLKDSFPSCQIDECKNADEVIAFLRNGDYDLAILDLNMPKTSGIDLIGKALRLKPQLKVLILSMNNEFIYSTRVIDEGAKGYMSKEHDLIKLRDAIIKVLEGGIYLSDNVIEQLLDRNHSKKFTDNPFHMLTQRELEVAKLIFEGKSIKDILNILKKSQSTVSTQKANLFEKLGVESNSEFFEMARLYKLNEVNYSS